MILVDTSVMIDWLKNIENPKTELFSKILLSSAPYALSVLTYQEVLQGARDNAEREKLKEYLSTQSIHYLPTELSFYDEAAKIYGLLRSKGKTVRSTIDLLIAVTAIHNEAKLLHNDRDFDVIASEVEELEIMGL